MTAGSGPQPSYSFTGNNNRMDGYSYDAAGNLLNDGTAGYVYDDENRIVQIVGGASYMYDANGQRVRKITGSGTFDYLFDLAGHQVTELMGSSTISPATVSVRFTNDSCSGCGGGTPVGGGDRNLFVNSITLGTTTIQPSDSRISYTAAPCNSTTSGIGYILCNGDMIFSNSTGLDGQTITVNAWGSPDYNVYPHMQLLVNGTVVAEWDVSGGAQNYSVNAGMSRSEIYAGNRHLGTYTNGTTYFSHEDHLGTERARSNADGTLYETCINLPFGDGQSCTGGDPSPMHFTGKERDTLGGETGLDYFGARYLSSVMGRWMSPDWADKPTNVPYSDFGDPQSLNLYGYVRDNPMNRLDPSGHVQEQEPARPATPNAEGKVEDEDDAELEAFLERAAERQRELNALKPIDPATPDTKGGWDDPTTGECHLNPPTKDDAERVSKALNEGEKTYQTYTKINPQTGEVYSGMTSGTDTPERNVVKRDSVPHQKNADGFGPAALDRSSSNRDAIRGREQQLHEHFQAQGRSGNVNNPVGPRNANAQRYRDAANKEFGPIDK